MVPQGPLSRHDSADRILQCWMQKRACCFGRRRRSPLPSFWEPCGCTALPASTISISPPVSFRPGSAPFLSPCAATFPITCRSKSATRWRFQLSVSGWPAFSPSNSASSQAGSLFPRSCGWLACSSRRCGKAWFRVSCFTMPVPRSLTSCWPASFWRTGAGHR